MPEEGQSPLVDSAGQPWVFDAKGKAVWPGLPERRWTEKQVIGLFNESRLVKESGLSYSARSLSAQRLDRILSDVVGLVLESGGR